MSGIERKYQKSIDELILNATPEELQKIQELDINSQLSGNSFYDSYANQKNDVKIESHTLPKKN
ncbi:hypothetical protein C6988_10875, partial [Nitrosopumilus sp. b1]|uniref:hypothetical protein n=1 Tax=Nitrosopumilus sp. b1 TaxID=2109907 RepID=UPI0015F707DC